MTGSVCALYKKPDIIDTHKVSHTSSAGHTHTSQVRRHRGVDINSCLTSVLFMAEVILSATVFDVKCLIEVMLTPADRIPKP